MQIYLTPRTANGHGAETGPSSAWVPQLHRTAPLPLVAPHTLLPRVQAIHIQHRTHLTNPRRRPTTTALLSFGVTEALQQIVNMPR